MSEYKAIVKRRSDDELMHWKYIKREKVGDKWKYWYDKGGSGKKTSIKSLNTLSSIRSKVTEMFKKPFSKTTLDEKVKKKVDELISNVSKTVDKQSEKIIDSITGRKHKYIAKVKLKNGKHRYFYSTEEYNTYLRRQNYQKNEPSFMRKVKEIDYSDLSKKTKEFSKENDLLVTNKPYPTKGYTKNCAYCTAAYELRCRGYDVVANMDPDKAGNSPNTDKKMAGWYKGAEIKELKPMSFGEKLLVKSGLKKREDYTSFSAKELETALSNYPPNSRGNLSVSWKKGSGHSMIWETDVNGKVTVRDAQDDTKEVSLDTLASYGCNPTFWRTDNLQLDESITEVFKENGK